MAVEMLHNWRRPGCGEGCREVWRLLPDLTGRERIEIHDPEAHEDYGFSVAHRGRQLRTTVRAGALAVDLRRGFASVAGQAVLLSPREWALLSALAEAGGALVPHISLRQAVHGAEWEEFSENHVRVIVNRLRGKLGPLGALIEAHRALGYRLRVDTEDSDGG